MNGPTLAISRRNGQILWQREIDLMRWIPQQWRGMPVLVYGSVVPELVPGPGDQQLTKAVPQVLVVDKQTGKTLSKFPESFEGRIVSLVADPKTGRYVINFDTGSLLVEPAP
ncbi:hypothetical protein GYB59_24065 [bacterium]|nr:hypothetical protein [bacterium]